MYKCYLDGELLYHPNMTYELPLARARLKMEVNKTGTFVFTIYKNNAKYGSIKKMKSMVKVYDDNDRLFRGRVLNAKRGMYNELQVTCEGELAFFLDSVVRPYQFEGTVEEYFRFFVNTHNFQVDEEKQFKIGICTVTDPNDYIVRANSNCTKTLNEMKEKLVGLLGGYLWTREEEDGVYIDYLKDFDKLNQQPVKFGENLLDFEEVIKGSDIATAIIPYGAKLKDEEGNETGERLTIKDINDGIDYVYSQEAVDKYGWIIDTVVFDDVTLPSNLKRKAEEELANRIHLTQTIELSAVDLHALNLKIQSFRLGYYTQVESEPHDFNDLFLTRKLSINILDPADSSLSLGDERRTFVDKQVENDKIIHGLIGKVVEDCETMVGESVQIIESRTSSKIEQMSDEIILQVGTSYYTKGDIEAIVKELKSSIAQTAEGIQIDISKLDKDLQDKFNLISKYFTFDIDGLTIGQVDNPYKVVIDNDRFSMMVNDIEVLWIANGEVHAPEITVERKMTVLGYISEMDEEGRVNEYYVGGDF